jgi:hypothetical protein
MTQQRAFADLPRSGDHNDLESAGVARKRLLNMTLKIVHDPEIITYIGVVNPVYSGNFFDCFDFEIVTPRPTHRRTP